MTLAKIICVASALTYLEDIFYSLYTRFTLDLVLGESKTKSVPVELQVQSEENWKLTYFYWLKIQKLCYSKLRWMLSEMS